MHDAAAVELCEYGERCTVYHSFTLCALISQA
jgi:hypothetical protein